jgi:hypothetical protein
MQTLLASAVTGVRQGNVAGFPAIGTIEEPVCAHAHVVLAFANGAVLLAGAMLFRLVTHRAHDGTRHGNLQGKLYLTLAMRGKASALDPAIAYSPSPSICGPIGLQPQLLTQHLHWHGKVLDQITHKTCLVTLLRPSVCPYLY